MSDTEFDPTAEETISYPRKTQNSERKTFYPADDNTVAIMYVEIPVGQKVATMDALRAIGDTCVKSKFFKRWKVTSEEGKRAAVHVRAQVHNDIQLGD
jgi:hypothetical protein